MGHLHTPIIYNLFPLLAGSADRWPLHAERAAGMGFNWLYLNPVHEPGFSGSLYAIKDHARLHPALVPSGAEDDRLEQLIPILREIKRLSLHPMVDLVINHTARDSPLVEQHPSWYVRDERGEVVSPFVVDPDDPARITTWGDLAEIANEGSPDRDELWSYWARLVERYLRVGFEGFRCDAAYKVPAELWRYLVRVASAINPSVRFFAENLGCTPRQTCALRRSGLHFFANSSKWWDFKAPWCLKQHRQFRDLPSLSFPETHDTERLASESNGNEAVQRQRYAFAAVFSAGLLMPIGYEYGFRRKLDVVRTTPADWEPPAFDLTEFVARVNRLKLELPVLQGEGALEPVPLEAGQILALERRSNRAPGEVAWVLVNRSPNVSGWVPLDWLPADRRHLRLLRVCREGAEAEAGPVPDGLHLDPAELALVLPDPRYNGE